MKDAICKDSCYAGDRYYQKGKTYTVDETNKFFQRHFEFGSDEKLSEKAKEA